MEINEVHVDSRSAGDPNRFPTFRDLEASLSLLPGSPRESGRVALIVRRVDGGRRQTPANGRPSPDAGVPEDAWGRGKTPHPEAQIAVMQTDVAGLIANGQPLTLFGDNLFIDLDLSHDNLPAGSRVRVGEAVLQVTPFPPNGCKKLLSRFGQEALHFVSTRGLRNRNLHGIYMRVIEAGEVRPGDEVRVIRRDDGSD
jgi:MOSC domain-containing protein YiiM